VALSFPRAYILAPVSLTRIAEAALAELEAEGLRRHPRQVDGPQRPRMVVDGRQVLCMCSNNYLGLASHPVLAAALREGLEVEGLGAGASRQISGNMSAHRRLEEALAGFVGQPSATLFATGYMANLGVLQALAGASDIIFSDELNHASLIDGARLSRARVVIYRHLDLDDLDAKLRAQRAEGRVALVVSESLFSMDGDQVELRELRQLVDRFDAGLVLDEAHALGVFGERGAGLARAAGITPDVTLGTLGKALGAQGAFAAAAGPVIDLVRNRARSFVFSTAPSPALAHAAYGALRLAAAADGQRTSLRRHWQRLRAGLGELGYRVGPGDSAIIPVLVGDAARTMALSGVLFERGVFVHGIRPPTVPVGASRLRLSPMATHTDADIAEVLSAFEEAGR
jgi:8-amino-7-oxononanoate synthase